MADKILYVGVALNKEPTPVLDAVITTLLGICAGLLILGAI